MSSLNDKMRAFGDEIETLKAADRWTESEFLRILREAIAFENAPPGTFSRTHFILVEAEPEWLERIKGR